jgi:hypothetical protein
LEALEIEIERVVRRSGEDEGPSDPAPAVPQVRLSLEEVERQFDEWEEYWEDEEAEAEEDDEDEEET